MTTSAGSESSSVPLGPNAYVLADQAQGGGGDLLQMPGGTIGGVHVIQGGKVECNDRAESPPCPNSGERRRSWNLDIGSGDGVNHRGDLGFNYDVGNCIKLFDGRKHAGITICPSANHKRAVIKIKGTLILNGKRVRP